MTNNSGLVCPLCGSNDVAYVKQVGIHKSQWECFECFEEDGKGKKHYNSFIISKSSDE